MQRFTVRPNPATIVGAVGVFLAGALIVFAAPVVRAEYPRLFVSDLETAVREQKALSAARLGDLAGVLRDSYAYRRDPALAQELALIELLLLQEHRASPSGTDYEAVAARLREGLAERPAAPHAWTRLALVRFQQDRDWQAVRDAFVLAVTTGPTVRRLTVPRLDIGLRLWDRLDEYERGLVRRQAPLAFEENPKATVRVALGAGKVRLVRRELRSLGAQARFDELLAQLRT